MASPLASGGADFSFLIPKTPGALDLAQETRANSEVINSGLNQSIDNAAQFEEGQRAEQRLVLEKQESNARLQAQQQEQEMRRILFPLEKQKAEFEFISAMEKMQQSEHAFNVAKEERVGTIVERDAFANAYQALQGVKPEEIDSYTNPAFTDAHQIAGLERAKSLRKQELGYRQFAASADTVRQVNLEVASANTAEIASLTKEGHLQPGEVKLTQDGAPDNLEAFNRAKYQSRVAKVKSLAEQGFIDKGLDLSLPNGSPTATDFSSLDSVIREGERKRAIKETTEATRATTVGKLFDQYGIPFENYVAKRVSTADKARQAAMEADFSRIGSSRTLQLDPKAQAREFDAALIKWGIKSADELGQAPAKPTKVVRHPTSGKLFEIDLTTKKVIREVTE